jgi:hypothetical protein
MAVCTSSFPVPECRFNSSSSRASIMVYYFYGPVDPNWSNFWVSGPNDHGPKVQRNCIQSKWTSLDQEKRYQNHGPRPGLDHVFFQEKGPRNLKIVFLSLK